MFVSSDQLEPDELVDLTVYPSLYAYSAYAARYDDTPIDALVRAYYLDSSQPVA